MRFIREISFENKIDEFVLANEQTKSFVKSRKKRKKNSKKSAHRLFSLFDQTQ